MATKEEGVHETSLITWVGHGARADGRRRAGGIAGDSSRKDVTTMMATSSGTSISRNKGFTIYVGTWKGAMVTLGRAKGTDAVGRIKERMSAEEGTPADLQILVFEEEELEDDRTLDFYRISDGSYLIQRCRRYVCNTRA